MFKHEIEYTDFNGNDQKETFYFHLSTPEVTRLEAEFGTTLVTHITRLKDSNDADGLIKFFEKMVLNSYGKKSADGKQFRKTTEIREEFEYSQAYAELFEKLLTDEAFAQKFGEGIVTKTKQPSVPAHVAK